MKKYLCTINWKDAPQEYVMDNEVVEETGRTNPADEIWVRRVGTNEEFLAYPGELWPITEAMARALVDMAKAEEPGF